VGEHFGISCETALETIRQYVPTNNRSQAMQTANNQLIVDAYNANPTSMQAAINAFKGDTYILGAMRELGEYSHLEHQNIVNIWLSARLMLYSWWVRNICKLLRHILCLRM
jgi:UDP-N-acetylmuramoyl-tripeptide--D-alanyl-D-alanine ligase